MSFAHHPFYCEENIWHLCADRRVPGEDKHVLIVSNEGRRVAMWGQKAARAPGEVVVWDYHVVLMARAATWRVWDLDSTLELGVSLAGWLAGTFDPAVTPPSLQPVFRCVEAGIYRRELASDRRHMRLPDGTAVSPPPPWPRIGDGHNLDRFIDMGGRGPGTVLDMAALERRFAQL